MNPNAASLSMPGPMAWACSVALCMALWGCGSMFSMTTDDIARGYLPDVRYVHHPDSLVDLRLDPAPDSVAVTLDQQLAQMTRKWSAAPNVRHRGPGFSERTFATLISRELALAHTATAFGTDDLSASVAASLFEQAEADYQEFVVIDLHLFAPHMMDANPSYSNIRFNLEVDDTLSVAPVDVVTHGRPQRSTLENQRGPGAEYLYYMRSSLVFPRRDEDGSDRIADANSVRLYITILSRMGARSFFDWRFDASGPTLSTNAPGS
ncbi:MAG: hypothetical protein PPP56_11625 [Longimonas sp.]|uniref:hypothetical protein n=1 Tax=Longimonas sp. TaxID=2039626 RepID=UPI00334AB34C